MNIFDYPNNLKLKMPMVSIVVTNYNYANYIIPCLESITAQTYQNWECIIVDDCSTDNSAELIKEYIHLKGKSKKKFKFIQSVENGGQMKSIELGLKKASGEFLVSIDADDLIYSNFLERHLFFHLNSDVPFAFTCSNHIQIDENNNILAGGFSPHMALKENRFIHPFDLFGDWIWTAMSCVLFRKPVLDLIMPEMTSDFKICADFYLFNMATILGGSLIMPEFLGCYRRHCKNNFSFNKVISGLANPGDITKEPEKDVVRKVMLSQIDKNYNEYYNYFGIQGIERIVYNISSRSQKISEFRNDYPRLFQNSKAIPHHIEQDKEILFKMYYSLPGRIILNCIKILVKTKERIVGH